MHTAIYWPAGATAADEANNLIIVIYFFRVAPLRTSKRRDSLLWDLNVLERVHVYFVWPNDFAIKLQVCLFFLAFFFFNQIFVHEIKANHTHTASFSHRFAANSHVTVFLLCVKQQQRQQHWAKNKLHSCLSPGFINVGVPSSADRLRSLDDGLTGCNTRVRVTVSQTGNPQRWSQQQMNG